MKLISYKSVSVQYLPSLKEAPVAKDPAFFKGHDAASLDGRTLEVVVPAKTLKNNGLHRICSYPGTYSHQPILSPQAQRGSQGDCIKVKVTNAVAA
jgi:hypothetical protein